MHRMRPPMIVGLTPGAGASTLAAALHARDGGPLAPRVAREADVLLARGHPAALRRLTAVACAPGCPPPVLAVVASPAHRVALPPAMRFSAVVVLPWVPTWSGRPGPPAGAADVLALRHDQLPGPLRAYAAALRRLVAAAVGAGVLACGTPPLVALPSPPTLWRGLRAGDPSPVRSSRPGPGGPPAAARQPEPDDDALESEHLRTAAGRVG